MTNRVEKQCERQNCAWDAFHLYSKFAKPFNSFHFFCAGHQNGTFWSFTASPRRTPASLRRWTRRILPPPGQTGPPGWSSHGRRGWRSQRWSAGIGGECGDSNIQPHTFSRYFCPFFTFTHRKKKPAFLVLLEILRSFCGTFCASLLENAAKSLRSLKKNFADCIQLKNRF